MATSLIIFLMHYKGNGVGIPRIIIEILNGRTTFRQKFLGQNNVKNTSYENFLKILLLILF